MLVNSDDEAATSTATHLKKLTKVSAQRSSAEGVASKIHRAVRIGASNTERTSIEHNTYNNIPGADGESMWGMGDYDDMDDDDQPPFYFDAPESTLADEGTEQWPPPNYSPLDAVMLPFRPISVSKRSELQDMGMAQLAEHSVPQGAYMKNEKKKEKLNADLDAVPDRPLIITVQLPSELGLPLDRGVPAYNQQSSGSGSGSGSSARPQHASDSARGATGLEDTLPGAGRSRARHLAAHQRNRSVGTLGTAPAKATNATSLASITSAVPNTTPTTTQVSGNGSTARSGDHSKDHSLLDGGGVLGGGGRRQSTRE
jgi:hypothetical protein